MVPALNWLRDLPPLGDPKPNAPPADAADWERWWLRVDEHWRGRISGPHPLYSQPLPPKVINQIPAPQLKAAHRIVHAVIAYPCANEPHPVSLARIIASANPDETVRLSHVHNVARRVASLRRQSGLLPKPAPAPETLAETLKGNGTPHACDCGRLKEPAAMRRDFPRASLLQMTADPINSIWYAGTQGNDIIAQHRHPPRHDGESGRHDPLQDAETALIEVLAPDDPVASVCLFNAMAIDRQITPAQACAIAIGTTSRGKPIQPPGTCPRVDRCASKCASAQKKGIMPFAATWTGDYRDCAYYGYLEEATRATDRDRLALAESWPSNGRNPRSDRPDFNQQGRRREGNPDRQSPLFD